MAIITIARELGSLGEETARELAKISGYRLIDKEYLESKLNEIGITAEKRQKFDERNPGFWASLSQQRDDYLHFLKTAILDAAQDNNCIIMGRGANAILRGVPHMIAVKITSPIAARVERTKVNFSCDNKRAMQIVEQSDHDRGGFHKYFFSAAWTDPREYDLTINTGSTDPTHAAVAIDALRKVYIDAAREEAGVQKISDLVLGQKVVTEIIYTRKVPVHFLEATVEKNSVVLHGVANAQSSIDTALASAHGVPGVKNVESAIQLVQEFTVMP
jgi:cytidylate kinase